MKKENSHTKDNNKRKRMFGSAVFASALGRLIAGQKLSRSRPIPHLKIWRPTLVEKWGQAQAALLVARLQTRYDELYAARPRSTHRALSAHLERGIWPGLALYQVLLEETSDQAAALAAWDRLFRASISQNSKSKLLRLLGRLPNPFPLFRWANRRTLQRQFPPAGWAIEWVEDNNQRIAYNIHDCFYRSVLADYGAPELTSHFCQLDDVLFEALPPSITWDRTQTLALGGDCCDFRWCNAPGQMAKERLGKDGAA